MESWEVRCEDTVWNRVTLTIEKVQCSHILRRRFALPHEVLVAKPGLVRWDARPDEAPDATLAPGDFAQVEVDAARSKRAFLTDARAAAARALSSN